MANKTIPAASIDAKLLFERLKQLKQGETITYAELSKIIETDVRQRRARGYLATAVRMARNARIDIQCVRGVGLQWREDKQTARHGTHVAKRIAKAARNGAKTLACVQDFNAMTKAEQAAHNAGMSILGAIAQALKPSIVEKIEEATTKAQKELPIGKTLALFGG